MTVTIIERDKRRHVADLAVAHEHHVSVVENEPFAIETRGGDGVIFIVRPVMQDNDAQIARGQAGLAQGDIFGDGIVLAVAGAAGEGRQRRRPHVGGLVLGDIAHRPDGEIDRSVDCANAGAAVARAGVIDDG